MSHDKPTRHIDEVTQIGNLTLVRFSRDLVAKTMGQVAKEFKVATYGLEINHMLLDFKNVSQVDSSLIAELLDLMSYIRSRHPKAKVGIVHAPSQLESLLHLAKVGHLFTYYQDEQKALDELS